MPAKPRLFAPDVLGLEARNLLSAATVSSLRAMTKPLLSETLEGRYQTGQDNRAADAPLRVKLNGVGTADRSNRVSGVLNLGGFRRADAPDVSGTVTLTNPRGSIKLRVTGTGGNGPVAGSEIALNAGVLKGTGAFKNIQAVGPATLSFATDPVRQGQASSGHARLALDLNSPVR